MDSFTRHRITKFVESFRSSRAQLPTLRDFEQNHFDKQTVELAVKERVLTELYITLTTGAVVKGYKARAD